MKPVFIVFLFFHVINAGFVFSQSTDTSPPQIVNPDEEIIVNYCSDSIAVAPNITIQSIKIDEPSEGMKISIANYHREEDVLVWDKVHGFEYKWVDYYGTLEIKGIGSSEQYQEAIKKVYYKNLSNVPTLGVRSFSISLLDADYLPETEHFYRYVSKLDITWKEARDSAESMNYYGLKGYLATIRSKVENDFIWTKIDGIGWIGASDAEVEGTWKWVTGPDSSVVFWQGATDGRPVNGEYSNWVPNHEPNNLNDEDFAHINQHPDRPQKSWNDLDNETNPNSEYYRAQGFIVEFGGYEDDPKVKLSASSLIGVSKIAFSDEREFEMCQGESQELNLVADESYSYTWTPENGINSTTISNPVVNPGSNTTYTAIGRLDACVDTAEFKIKVNSLPVGELRPDTTICKGQIIILDPGEHKSYLWNNGQTSRTISVSSEKLFSVKLTNEYGCFSYDTIKVNWSIVPEWEYIDLHNLVCGKKSQEINISILRGSVTSTLIPLQPEKAEVQNATTLNPTIKVSEYGVYQFVLEVIDQYLCTYLDTLNIEFHNQPAAEFNLDEEECIGYSLDLKFTGTTYENAFFTWYSNDTIFQSGIGLESVVIPLGYGQLNRSVGLKVNEQGCVDFNTKKVSVTPVVNFWVEENPKGCTPLNTKFNNSDVEEIESYLWDFGDGNISTRKKPSNTYLNPGTSDLVYDVKLTVVSLEGCENTGVLKDTITVHPIPTIGFSFEESTCHDESMKIWYKGSGNNKDAYLWNLSDFKEGEIISDPGTTQGPLEIKRSSEPTVDIGLKVVSEFGCKTDSIKKTWKRKPVFDLTLDEQEGCPPLQIKFKASVYENVDLVYFYYDLGDGTIGNGDTVTHIYNVSDKKYDIRFTANSSITGCSETIELPQKVFVYPVPEAAFVPEPEVVLISDPTILFNNMSKGATSYEWDFRDNSAIAIDESPEHYYTKMGFFNVLLTAYNDFGCIDTATNRVAVAFDKIYPPNAFSPNAMNEEDQEFRIYSEGIADEGYQLLVFSRWGEVIFKSTNQKNGWKGKMNNGNFAPAGVYTWIIQYKDFMGDNHKQQGTVTLIF